MKTHNTFFNNKISSLIRKNLKTNKAAAKMAAEFIYKTSYWMNLSYSELQSLVFTPELKRSWFVRSDGSCPSCKKSVPMYNWKYDPVNIPWKMRCPHCSELFPKNDFKEYYVSGLDSNGDFHHEFSDRSLLVNKEGSDFGVDDGNGWYNEDGFRYMFIGAYLAHAHWSMLIVDGILNLSFSYTLTGNIEYARRAALILGSVSRHFPEYDFYTQGIMYEQEHRSNGYVSYWAGSNNDVKIFALAYDQIFEALQADIDFEDIFGKNVDSFCSIIENRIFHDALNNMKKIQTNPPEASITVAILKSVLNYDTNDIVKYIDDIIYKTTMVDGLSGEKGLAGYASLAPRAIANLLCLYTNTDSCFIEKTLTKHPQLHKTYRFHIDSWYDAKYYPGVGDSSVFALPIKVYAGLFSSFGSNYSILYRSNEWFSLKLSQYFNDPDLAKIIYLSNGNIAKGCFDRDYYIAHPKEYEANITELIDKSGTALNQKSVNYAKWRISLLFTGKDSNKTLLAMPYDSGANHCHHDALSIHLFSKGLNMMPDFGYPPVNHGGWDTKEVRWYRHPAAHNQVVIDGEKHTNLPPEGEGKFCRYPEFGQNLMFSSGSFVQATYNDSKEYVNTDRYERLVALIDITDSDCYCVDISRTEGGLEHSRFLRSTYSTTTTDGLNLSRGEMYYPDKTIMRNLLTDNNPGEAWSIDFKTLSDNKETPADRDLHLKYTGLTKNVSVSTCESWVDITRMVQTSNVRTGDTSVWIPTIFETKKGPRTCFTGILEPYEDSSKILSINRPTVIFPGDFDDVVEIIFTDGTKDLIIANDPKTSSSILLSDYGIESDALLTVIRIKDLKISKVTVCSGTYFAINGTSYTTDSAPFPIEFV